MYVCIYIYISLSLSPSESWFSLLRFLSQALIFSLFFLVLRSKGRPSMKQNFATRLQCHGRELHRRQGQQGQQQSSCGCSIACRFGGLRGSPQLQRLEGGWRSEHKDGRTVKLLDIIFNRPQEHEEPSDPPQVPKIPSSMALFALLVAVPLWSGTHWLWRQANNLLQMAPLVFTHSWHVELREECLWPLPTRSCNYCQTCIDRDSYKRYSWRHLACIFAI